MLGQRQYFRWPDVAKWRWPDVILSNGPTLARQWQNAVGVGKPPLDSQNIHTVYFYCWTDAIFFQFARNWHNNIMQMSSLKCYTTFKVKLGPNYIRANYNKLIEAYRGGPPCRDFSCNRSHSSGKTSTPCTQDGVGRRNESCRHFSLRCSEWLFCNIYITHISLLSPHVPTTCPPLVYLEV